MGVLPAVTVQLPVYNEIHVLERLVAAACALRYPRDRLEIQILDDSTDATRTHAARLARRWRRRGVDVSCIHRSRRAGYKAGALQAGLAKARGALVAVFDADFLPPADFLERAVPWFGDPGIGMVQARWGHLNRSHSALTRAQALMLDAHFGVEQSARFSAGRFFNFNGTAGIFRRECIEHAGGWQADTLTEDLDLSYRAQLAGWRFVFIDDLVCPAELPVEMDALRTQQHRWAKGSTQTAIKILPRLLRSSIPLRIKAEAAFHLTGGAGWAFLFLASLLVVPALAVRHASGSAPGWLDLAVFLAGTCSFGIYSAIPRSGSRREARTLLRDLPLAMALGAGMALNNTVAVAEAMAGSRSGFERTPKRGIVDGAPPRAGRLPRYRPLRSRLVPFELSLAAIFTAAAAWALSQGLYTALPFLALFGTGYAWVGILSLRQRVPTRRTEQAQPAA